MRLAWILAWLVIPGVAWADEWSPPENPDPQAILTEAEFDARAKNYEVALAKHVWFHEHALEIQPSLSGVRRSFALGSWLRLGEDYPPALAKLKDIRDKTRRRVEPADGTKFSFDDFHDLAALNRELDEESITVDAFRLLDERDPDAAERAFLVAQPALVKAKEYALCGKYIETDRSLRRIVDGYRRGLKYAENPRFGARHLEFATKKFINDSATLVALLVVNDRKAEADEVVVEVKKESGDARFHAQLAAALDEAIKGTVPKPWP